MKTTIKAKDSYRLCKFNFKDTDVNDILPEWRNPRALFDGDELVMICDYVPYADYVDEVENGNNECARFVECFMTRKGNKMVYWRDEESDVDYVSKVEE